MLEISIQEVYRAGAAGALPVERMHDGSAPRVLIISQDVVGSRMAGPGIRAWNMALALAERARVTLIAPRPIDLDSPAFRCGHFDWGDAASLAAWLGEADLIVANGYLLAAHPELAQTPAPLALDLYDPVLLENLELLRAAPAAERAARAADDQALLARQLAAGDFLLCATERQRDLYLGALMLAGRLTPALTDADALARDLIDVAPFGLPAEPPLKQAPALRGVLPSVGADDPLLLWTGGLWDWLDPLTLLDALPTVAARHPQVRLVFLAGAHPGTAGAMRMPGLARARAAELGLLERHVFFYDDWVPYERRADFLLEATVAVSLHRNHLETAYAAVRSRFLDHLWAGLPSLVSDGDAAAELVRRHDLGAVVPAEQPAALAAALTDLLDNPERLARCGANTRALGTQMRWPDTLRPLERWVAERGRPGLRTRPFPPASSLTNGAAAGDQSIRHIIQTVGATQVIQHVTANGRMLAVAGPRTTTVAQAAFYDISVENTTQDVWQNNGANPVNLSYHWLDERGATVVHDGMRTGLPAPLAPGERGQLVARVHPPLAPGRYRLVFDLVRENDRWLGDEAMIEVEVGAAARRVVLVNMNCLAHDAVGNNIVRKLRLLQSWGFAPLLLCAFIDSRLPRDVQVMMVEIGVEQVLGPNANLGWAAAHFAQSELYIFDYSNYYSLLSLMQHVTDRPIIFDYHSVTPPELWQSATGLDEVALGVKNVVLVAHADYAIAHSAFTAEELIATGLIDAERVSVQPYAVPIDRFQPGESAPELQALTNGRRPILLYVGRMAGNKRIDQLVRMLPQVAREYPNVLLLLVGDDTTPPYGALVAEARALAAALGVSENVLFTGPKGHDELPSFYNVCDVYVTSSQHEGFCIPVVEAMACGKPVVVSNVTALPWTVGDAGLLFDPEDAPALAAQVLRLLRSQSDPADPLYAELSRRGVARAHEFTAEHYAQHLRALVDRVLGAADGARVAQPDRLRAVRDLSVISYAGYRVQSALPLVGPLVAWLRTQLTSHLKGPYLDPIVARQEQFNRAATESVVQLAQQHAQTQRTLHKLLHVAGKTRRIVELEARIVELEARLAALGEPENIET